MRLPADPGIGFSGSPSIFTPHAREVALALDYWLEPSIVWQNEVDLELPEAGGSILSPSKAPPHPRPGPKVRRPMTWSFRASYRSGSEEGGERDAD